eukprot:m.53282 g.53282  ORF g.53282 m.53282 type:complete len:102 (-) comp16645_c0_seq3:86-391(-)
MGAEYCSVIPAGSPVCTPPPGSIDTSSVTISFGPSWVIADCGSLTPSTQAAMTVTEPAAFSTTQLVDVATEAVMVTTPAFGAEERGKVSTRPHMCNCQRGL